MLAPIVHTLQLAAWPADDGIPDNYYFVFLPHLEALEHGVLLLGSGWFCSDIEVGVVLPAYVNFSCKHPELSIGACLGSLECPLPRPP